MSEVTKAKDGHVFIATYGSLRRSMENFRVNGHGGGEFFGLGKSVANINLYRYGSSYFPSVSLKHDSNGIPVVLDVFQAPVDGMEGAYDMLEGYPSFYNRTEIPVLLEDGTEVMAWIYHIDEEQPYLVKSGDWCVENRGHDYYNNL